MTRSSAVLALSTTSSPAPAPAAPAAPAAAPVAAAAPATLAAVEDLLDDALYAIGTGARLDGAVRDLMAGLNHARLALGERWPQAIELCLRHPLYSLFGADPITARARAKPRGYAGDAVMIDYIYQGLPAAERATISPLGAALFAATTASPSAVAVRDRRDLLTRRIDACADRVDRPRVLSLACGHLREAARSTAVRWRELGELTAIDQDPDSLAVIAATHADAPEIVPTVGSVRDLLRGAMKVSGYDLAYAAGLYDYLPTAIATRLTALMFRALAPGGELLIGNFARDYGTIGYTEAFMDWHLICRTEAELRGLAGTIPAGEIASLATHTDRTGCIVYLTIVKA